MQSGLSGVALPRDATANSSVRPSVRDVDGWACWGNEVAQAYRDHTLEFFQNSFTISYLGM